MQIKFKKQIDIELDKSDLLEAVRDLLAKNGQSVTTEELEAVKFINSPQTGIRAELKITEESGDASSIINGTPTDVVVTTLEAKVTQIDGGKITPLAAPVPVAEEPEPVAPVEPEAEEPGDIATATVEDVMPGIAEIKQMVEEPTPVDASAAPSAESLRTSLF